MLSTPNPIFPDRTARPSDYKQFGDDLYVTKIFATIQGEGPFAGHRCVFVRLAGCNLGGKGLDGPGCSFCDTDFRFANGQRMSIDEVYNQIEQLHPDRERLVVITGGEPMLQSNLTKFFQEARHRSGTYTFQIESNGSMLQPLPEGEIGAINEVVLVISPKVVESAHLVSQAKYTTLPLDVLHRADYFKFVVSADEDSPYHKLPDWIFEGFQPRIIYVSPMAVYQPGMVSPNNQAPSIWSLYFDQRQCARNHAYAAELAMRHGFIVSVQMHLYCAVE